MNIASARRQAVQLRRSIDGVVTSLHRIEEDLMRSDGLADLLTKFMDRFVEKLLLENYRALKASAYNPMRFQRSIQTNTERFINDEGQISRAAVALADQALARTSPRPECRSCRISRGYATYSPVWEKSSILSTASRTSSNAASPPPCDIRKRPATFARSGFETPFASHSHSGRRKRHVSRPLVEIPVPYSTATLALPKKAREPVEPQTRQPKTIDPADVLREQHDRRLCGRHGRQPNAVAERMRMVVTADAFFDLDQFEPETARDIAILYEVRAARSAVPEFEIRKGLSRNRTASFPGRACWCAAGRQGMIVFSRWATRQAGQDPNVTAEQLTETANRLLHRQFITRGDFGGATHFDRIVSNLDYFKDVFATFGFRFIFNDAWGYAGYVSPTAYNNARVPTQETIVLLCLRLLYDEGAEKGYFVNSSAQILVDEDEIQTVFSSMGSRASSPANCGPSSRHSSARASSHSTRPIPFRSRQIS